MLHCSAALQQCGWHEWPACGPVGLQIRPTNLLLIASHTTTQGDMVGARKGFEKALRMRCNGRSSIAAQLALAALHFNQRNYHEALKLCAAAMLCSHLPPLCTCSCLLPVAVTLQPLLS